MDASQLTHVELEFQDLSYSPPGQEKEILTDVNGRFRPFKVSAILGPSGAGKTSLLNILTCNRWAGVRGNIIVNGQSWNRSQFRKRCCYIAQEFDMMDVLTVRETLQIAANLKLPGSIWCAKRKVQIEDKVEEILQLLGLKKEQNTQVQYLSGGQKKRLSIGVELVTNPPVMFFDEPTSGLDSSASLMVMEHLQSLAQRGVTVVVVIHQPSSRCFQYCDDVLLLSCGRSLFNGPASTLAETFSSLGFHCPPYFNIAEFAVEIANMKPDQVRCLTDNAQEFYRSRSGDFFSDLARLSLKGGGEETSPMLFGEDNNHTRVTIQIQRSSSTQGYPISTLAQFCILFKRCTLCTNRDMQLFRVRITTHALVSILLGILFYNFGTDASKVYGNFSFIFFNVLFVFFATSMPTISSFPKEAKVFLREQSNNWYSVRAYYFAKILADLPLQILCPTIFVSVGWYLTGQPLVFYRFGMLWLVSVLVAILAQTFGNACGAALSIETAMFVVPSSTIPVLLLSGFFVTMKDLYAPFQVLSEISYFKFAFEAACQSVFGYNRPKLACSLPYCHYKKFSKFLLDIGMSDFTFWHNIMCLSSWILVVQIVLYVVLRWKVSQAKV